MCDGEVFIGAYGGQGGTTPIYKVSSTGDFNLTTSIDIRSADSEFGTMACGPGA